MKTGRVFASAFLAGMCIGLGGTVFLSVENRVVGAALFTVGLFSVCVFGFSLFTGKVCYALEMDITYAGSLPLIWLGNLAGTGAMAALAAFSRIGGIRERAAELCTVKLSDSLLSLFLLGVLCNILIYIAVEGYKTNPHGLGKFLPLFFGVMVFILAGTEHCVADMYYFWLSGWSTDALLRLLVITLGNSVGGLGFRSLHRFATVKGGQR